MIHSLTSGSSDGSKRMRDLNHRPPAKIIEEVASVRRAGAEHGYLLHVVGIRDDSLPSDWTARVSERAVHLLGPRHVRSDHWTIGALRDSLAFQRATEAATEADILVLAVRATGELPLTLTRWIDLWLPYRRERPGALVTVLGGPPPPNAYPCRIRSYLQDVARIARMDFLAHQRTLPAEGLSLRDHAVPASTQAHQAWLPRHAYRAPDR